MMPLKDKDYWMRRKRTYQYQSVTFSWSLKQRIYSRYKNLQRSGSYRLSISASKIYRSVNQLANLFDLQAQYTPIMISPSISENRTGASGGQQKGSGRVPAITPKRRPWLETAGQHQKCHRTSILRNWATWG
jgi:hypothetical protein